MAEIKAGDAVRCVDASSKPEWAAWYMDNGYADDMLVRGQRYLVRDVAERDGQIVAWAAASPSSMSPPPIGPSDPSIRSIASRRPIMSLRF